MWSQRRLLCLFLLLAAVLSVVVRADDNVQPKEDGDDVANPSGGASAAAVIQQSKQMMHTSADSADGGSDDSSDSKDSAQGDDAKPFPGGGDAKNMKSHGTCVTGCATQSTQTVGCGGDLSKPECFCKSQDFVVQAFTCVNATCPEQYHGAAGVFMSICGVVGGPGIEIPGYKGSSNLEQMPQVIPDSNNNKTNSSESSVAPPAGIVVTPPKSTPKVSTSIQYPTPSNAAATPAGAASSARHRHLIASSDALLAAALSSLALGIGFYTLV